MRAVLLQGGHRLPQLVGRGVRVCRGHDAVWPCLLPEGHRVRQSLDVDVCDGGCRVHSGADGVRELVLFVSAGM